MSANKAATWIAGTAFVAILLVVAGWFLAISPVVDRAAEAREQAESEQVRIDQMTAQLAVLKADYAKLDGYKADLAALRVQMPTDAQLADLTRQVAQMAEVSGVFVSSITQSPSLSLSDLAAASAQAAAAASAPATDAEGTADAQGGAAGAGTEAPAGDGAAAPAPAPAASVVPPGFYAIPIQLRVLGSYENTLRFLQVFQTGNPRLLLITSLDLQAQPASAAQGGQPAMADGDPASTINAYAFVLESTGQVTAVTTDDGSGSDTPLPVPNGQPNPFS